jgi:hypothetical protein
MDPEGRELSGLDAARRSALTEARSLVAHEALSGLIHLDQRIDVADARGEVVHTIEFQDAVRLVGGRD